MRVLPWEYAVRNLARSPLRLLLTVGSALLVVLLVLASSGFVRGMQQSLASSGEPDNIMLLGAGSEESVERSEIQIATATHLRASVPGIKVTLGEAHISPGVHLQAALTESAESDTPLPASLRGITPAAFLVHQRVRISQGRAPRPGADEIIVGRLAAIRLGLPPERLQIGGTLQFDQRKWTIVGTFEAAGTVMESEIWLPLADLLIATRRTAISCIVATLDTAEFADVDLFARQRLDLELVAVRESDYYSALATFFRPIQVVALVTAGLVALSGLFGGLNSMYAAFAVRIREFGALQALGFPRRAILLSLVQESVLATSLGALLASAVGLILLDGLAVRFSLGAFGLVIDSPVLALGMVAGLALGVAGSLPPAWRCLRPPIPAALKMS